MRRWRPVLRHERRAIRRSRCSISTRTTARIRIRSHRLKSIGQEVTPAERTVRVSLTSDSVDELDNSFDDEDDSFQESEGDDASSLHSYSHSLSRSRHSSSHKRSSKRYLLSTDDHSKKRSLKRIVELCPRFQMIPVLLQVSWKAIYTQTLRMRLLFKR